MKTIIFILANLSPSIAFAYIGPGMGIGAIISALGALLAIILAIFGILYYPIKRYFKNKRKNK